MSKKTITWLVATLGVVAGLLCLVFFAPFGYYAYEEDQRYQADVAIVRSIAEQLGYTPATQLRLYQDKRGSFDFTFDLIRLTFYTTDSPITFSNRIFETGWMEKYRHTTLGESLTNEFIQSPLNYGSPEKLVTLNGYYRTEDFDLGRQPPPLITNWRMKDEQASGKSFDIYYLQAPEGSVWQYDSRPLPGNIVMIEFDRIGQPTPGVPSVLCCP